MEAARSACPELVGKGRALQLILSGEMINAAEAYRIGLVNEVVPAAELIPRAEAILRQILANAPIAVQYSLEAVNKGLETSQAEGLVLVGLVIVWSLRGNRRQEGRNYRIPAKSAQRNSGGARGRNPRRHS